MPRLSLGLGVQTIRKVGGFSPGNLSGLSLWLKADAGVSLSGSNVTAWADQSGNNKNALPEAYNPSINVANSNPTFASNVVNGKPALYFDGTQYLKTANIFNGSNPRSMFVVYYVNDILSINAVCGIANESTPAAGTYFGIQARSDQDSNPYFSSNTYDLTGPAFEYNVWRLASADYNGTTTNLYSNGSLANSGVMSLNTATSSFYIGCDYYQPDPPTRTYYGGYICEIIAYNRVLTTIERQKVEAYLNTKYNVIPSINNMFLPKLWLKADAGVTLSGSNVTAWADQSGNGNNATAVDTPTLSTISGKTFMDFASGYFTGNELITSPYATIMCVARFSAQLDVSVMFEQFSNDLGGNMSIYWGFDLNNGFRLYNGQDLNSSSLTNNNQTYLFGATFNNDTGTLYLNSSQDASGYCGELTPAGNYLLGRWPDEQRTSYTMKMAEIIVYNRVLTTQERQQVEAYLNTKYAIY